MSFLIVCYELVRLELFGNLFYVLFGTKKRFDAQEKTAVLSTELALVMKKD